MFRKNISFPLTLLSSLPFRSFCYSVPKFTSKPNGKGVLVMIVDQNEENLVDSLGPVFKEDLKENKMDWVYKFENYENYEKCLLAYQKIKYEKETDRRKSLIKLATSITRQLTSKKIKDFDLYFPKKFSNEEASIFLNALILTNYKFDKKTYLDQQKEDAEDNGEKKKNPQFEPIENVNLLEERINLDDKYLNFKLKSAEAVLYARNLANKRANEANTEFILEEAKKLAQNCDKVDFFSLQGKDLEKEGLNLLYSVGKGSKNPPILINMNYKGNLEEKENVYSLIGKGLVFDAGGLNIKPTGYMETMYLDKCGACAVLGVFKAVSELNLKINLSCTIVLAENFVGSNSYRPSDIIKSHKGLTVEIGNTDAEGRLCLADAMSWTISSHKPHTLIELSTLTGACMVALGDTTAGLFSNNEKLADEILENGNKTEEKFWKMPINEEHRDAVKGESADLTNSAKTRYGGACSAAAFLEKFVEKDVKWAHIDIAGPAESKKDQGFLTSGATGFPVLTLLEYYLNKSKAV